MFANDVIEGIPDHPTEGTGEMNRTREVRQVYPESTGGVNRGGHLYMQTNEIRNAIIHHRWVTSGTLTEVERRLLKGRRDSAPPGL
jgi:hypothetical protein